MILKKLLQIIWILPSCLFMSLQVQAHKDVQVSSTSERVTINWNTSHFACGKATIIPHKMYAKKSNGDTQTLDKAILSGTPDSASTTTARGSGSVTLNYFPNGTYDFCVDFTAGSVCNFAGGATPVTQCTSARVNLNRPTPDGLDFDPDDFSRDASPNGFWNSNSIKNFYRFIHSNHSATISRYQFSRRINQSTTNLTGRVSGDQYLITSNNVPAGNHEICIDFDVRINGLFDGSHTERGLRTL